MIGGGDVDGDGTPDIAYYENNTNTTDSWVRVRSGATGQLLYSISRWGGPNLRTYSFGQALDFCADVDGDGCEDFIAGDPGGAASVLSGKDGTEVFYFWSIQTGSNFAETVAGPGDMHGAGTAGAGTSTAPAPATT